MKQQLLLLEDVDALGRKGEIVSAKSGYIRNYLLPKGLVVIASEHTLRKQEALKKEREEQAVVDRKASEELKAKIEAISLEIHVKVDPEGHMYGSVSAADIADLFGQKNLPIEKKNVQVTKPIKVTGKHTITLRLKEDVMVSCDLYIIGEGSKVPQAPVSETAPSETKEESTAE